MDRRFFIKSATIGTLSLVSFGLFMGPFDFFEKRSHLNLSKRHIDFVISILPIIVGTPNSRDIISIYGKDFLEHFENAINSLTWYQRLEFFGLLNICTSRIGKFYFSNYRSFLFQYKPNHYKALLSNLKDHDNPKLRAGFSALVSLINGTWYSRPWSWASIGYDGAIEL